MGCTCSLFLRYFLKILLLIIFPTSFSLLSLSKIPKFQMWISWLDSLISIHFSLMFLISLSFCSICWYISLTLSFIKFFHFCANISYFQYIPFVFIIITFFKLFEVVYRNSTNSSILISCMATLMDLYYLFVNSLGIFM